MHVVFKMHYLIEKTMLNILSLQRIQHTKESIKVLQETNNFQTA